MSRTTNAVAVSTIGIDTGKNTLHLIGLMSRELSFCERSLLAAGIQAGSRMYRRA